MPDIQSYCLKCRARVNMQDPHETVTASGATGWAGTCPQCGSGLFRLLKRGSAPAKVSTGEPTVASTSRSRAKTSKGGAKPGSESQAATPRRRTAARERAESQARNLVIVESPAKARTIQRYLGKDYQVRASVGHVRDLLRSRLSVDIEHGFTPTYRVPPDKKDIVKELRDAAARADHIFLATDPDREGEAIAWHLVAATGMDTARAQRVVFHEITRDAITDAFAHPRDLDQDLVDAQQARRILDRLVGYQWSPLLWEKVRGRLSAGRVQSVAVRLLVDRERERQSFTSEEYWTVDAILRQESALREFTARLTRIDGADAALGDRTAAERACQDLQVATYAVAGIKRSSKRRSPAPPFITSTLQQEAARVLGFQAARTMRVAQQLYEGVELGTEGSVGLITYMRTDSVQVADIAIAEVRDLVRSQYGVDYLPDTPNVYRTKSKSAQEAHEAIRPTSVLRQPEQLAKLLSKEQLALYRLIWRRFVASQMLPALYDTVTAEIEAGGQALAHSYGLRASGSILRFPGYLIVQSEKKDGEDEGVPLPPLSEGEPLVLIRLAPEQHFTEPAPRYTEASLIKELESNGIGRPSTYASIISTITARDYVKREGRSLVPTDVAFVVNDLLVKYFPDVMDVGFTAQMEDDLDGIAAGDKPWVPTVAAFYAPFSQLLERAHSEAESVHVKDEPAGVDCDKCGAPMVFKYGRFGKFIGCSRYPECKNTRPFLAKTGVRCPECGGELVQRRSKKGRTFYGCDRYPQCTFATYAVPVPQRCSKCGSLMVKQGRNQARCTACSAVEALRDGEAAPAAAGAA